MILIWYLLTKKGNKDVKLITRDTDYAVRAVCFIAGHEGKPVSVEGMVKSLKIPRAFLRKILQTLNNSRILKSFKGKNGGFLLNKTADKIYLKNIMNVFQGPLKINECIFKKQICPNIKTCPLRKRLNKIERFAVSEIDKITIASLL